jgi:hypothetical protein
MIKLNVGTSVADPNPDPDPPDPDPPDPRGFFLGRLDPDSLGRSMDPDPDPSIIKQK